MGKCFVPFCNTGYKSCKEKFSLFKPPNDEARLEAWRRAIPRKDRVLQRTDRVCEKHFASRFILKTWSAGIDGHVLMSGTRRAGLSKDAVPSIFEGAPSYLSRKIKSPRKQVKRLALPVAASVSSCNNNSSNLPTTASHIEVSPADNMETSSDDSCCVTKTGESNSCDSVFERLFSAVSCVSLPQPSWAAHLINLAGVRDVVFIDAAVAHRTSDGSSVLFNRKALHVKSNMEVQVYILDKLIDSAAIGVSPFATSALEVESMLKVVDGIDVCRGGPSLKDFPDVSPECAFVDCQKSWRHNKCLLVTPGGAICRLCSGLVDTLRIHADRRAARAKQGIPLKRFRLSVVPTQQQKLSALRHARSAVQRSRARLAKRNKLLLEQLQAAMKELTDLQEQDIKEKLKGFDIPPAQLLLIEECVSVARCASKTSRRYTDDWILLCLLLHIRSPATYSFLRNNDILPLPCVTTVRKYISMVGPKCGFDDNFFKALKIKVAGKTAFQRRGILILDEIQVRKEMAVNSQTMTYTGLVDQGEKNNQSKELADHGLVFAFAPFGETYLQPVAVFASKGPTKGTLLSQLLIQCIVHLEKAGLFVDGVVCDGASTNRAMWKQLGITGALGHVRNSFEHPMDSSRNVYVLSDTPHIFKCIRNRLLDKKVLKKDGKLIKWSCYDALYVADNENKAELKVCPKITFNHINPSKMLRMRVKLATQIFSNSVAKGILFYAKRGASRLTNVEPTVEFTLFLNDLFDALNRRFPAEGLKLEGRDFCVLESASAWLDSWEQQVVSGEIHKDLFLTQSTAEGLRVTLKSVRELSIYLLKDCDFKYVLTAKMNQDPLERFFGIIRQAGGQNEHPTFPTFLQLYRMLSLYSLVKPPKFGNCTLPDKRQAAVVTLSDIREIYKGSAAQRTGKLDELKRKLDGLIDEGSWECDDVFDFDDPDTDATVVECIVYYVTGFVSRKLRNGTTCSICKNALQGKQGLASVPEADLVNCKTRGWLTHPNMHLFDFFKYTEEQFAKYAGDRDAYDKTTDAVLENFHFTFPCGTHKEEMLAKLLHYYICLRMRQYCRQLKNRHEKKSHDLRKMAKLV
ncbi:hypothetical protein HPB51_027589 [Rhipicephalus microplus]|uniref:THAP-type domain-containing protein n=2 Tax=Rhipicephalus microplus TaxID=6941 RepID=A0A9J6CZQ0_RHIMP|nr:hypothetical protein HPB51_027589 [Rhipicephalus microplus]